jgi:hypothetical protein
VSIKSFILCLALVLSGGLSGCSTVEPPRQENVTYSKPSSENLQKIKIERISLTNEQLAKSVVEPEDKRENGSPLLAEERPVWTRDAPWNTRLYIFNSADTNRCVCVELLDHGAYEVHHTWLNNKMLFVKVPWGRLAETDFVLDTKTLRFAYIEDGFDYFTIEQQEEAESFNGYGLNENGTNGKITSRIFSIEGKVIQSTNEITYNDFYFGYFEDVSFEIQVGTNWERLPTEIFPGGTGYSSAGPIAGEIKNLNPGQVITNTLAARRYKPTQILTPNEWLKFHGGKYLKYKCNGDTNKLLFEARFQEQWASHQVLLANRCRGNTFAFDLTGVKWPQNLSNPSTVEARVKQTFDGGILYSPAFTLSSNQSRRVN